MSYTKANYRDVDELAGALHFMRGPLECDTVGFTVVECDPEWTGKEHDHAELDHEEVYFLVSGSATMVVEGETVELEPGDAIRVSPEATRQLRNGDEESMLIIAGAP
ncbi:cupin domain-containing protein [Haloferax larsenii]|uniref:Cupin domain-containing protein n=1 Tax=Haloferax larsenii TaxID=302484 RepID=A0ABY5RCC9_HALLR|nr:cupin domain-containing protein [Haloferax larsenii]UVE49824.1 cupin domain-containing protein [Haloferax larsenii]